MKSLIVPLLATASFSTFLICGMVAASSFNLQYTPHKFANINNAIWTSTPTRVDPSEQAFQREPGLVAVQTAVADVSGNENPSPAIESNVVQIATAPDQVQTASATEPVASGWCQARYKSYRESDNTYQPFSGGPRQQCNAPTPAPEVGTTANDNTPAAVAQNPEQSHTAWCEARYSSYRLADDTYQPLGGGERRVCASPLSSGANG